ncbi:STAS domain-containing protein [Streptomyces sp. NPDC002057]|uniref:STAS domain-containing protein n=1 Tax=Streptomyces sp. NPDC002057 TaxID=3154664 RepID=UPI00331FB615
MTTPHPDHLRLITVATENDVRIELVGDLDFDNADLLLSEVTDLLDSRPRLRELHLGFGGVGLVDSMGLSILLMIGRRTAEAQVRLHLDDRPAALDRLLVRTGTSVYFGTSPAADTGGTSGSPEDAATVRPTGPDHAA